MSRREILSNAIQKWGDEAQCMMCIEECGELIKALSKAYRTYGTEKHSQAITCVREEIADVQIMLDQMRLIYGDSTEQEDYKLRRLQERLKG